MKYINNQTSLVKRMAVLERSVSRESNEIKLRLICKNLVRHHGEREIIIDELYDIAEKRELSDDYVFGVIDSVMLSLSGESTFPEYNI
ncbi:hypothetical protein [Vibrio parahaemolyticus]|uniref:hypothetical protein n=1 Tax=Vibrio parahaemolyticus TaxID=670 RepID=UPI001E2D3F52|nr:hypothetical protein [Vibrio parahaemolyticus]MCD2151993.1 hypothetical protein [Vibrio parahaemolyticus]HCJ4668948.1 hypothetical protein [Vibrio parahaemolyticus]